LKNCGAVLTLLCLLVFPAGAVAEVQTIDFDTGTLNSPVSGQGDIGFPLAQGFRPYRTDVGIRAHSGTTVGDLGRCAEEAEASGGDAGSCEFFQARTRGVLSRTAKSITLFAGRFGPVELLDAPEQATLIAFNSVGSPVATTGPVPIDAGGFRTRLSVSRPAGDIAGFTVKATSGPAGENELAGDLGIDDLSVSFTDGGAPDFAVSATNQILALVEGQSLKVPVQITRLNGSSGPVRVSAIGLPKGVSAAPVTVSGSQSTAELTLVADHSVEDTNFAPLGVSLIADPLGDPNVAPALRTAVVKVRLARAFELEIEGIKERNLSTEYPLLIPVPDCAPHDVPLRLWRDIGLNREISLRIRENADEATGLPQGIDAEVLSGSIVSPGGGLVAERTLRFSADPSSFSNVVPLVLEARTGPDEPPHTIPLSLAHASSRAQLEQFRPGSSLGRTPRFGRPGTRVRVTGNGFCPGTKVQVGSAEELAPATLIDPNTIEFDVPREATSGEVDVVLPDRSARYRASGHLIIDSVRNVDGFPFDNFPLESLSLGEFTEAFGGDDLFINVNPCWPFGNCRVPTGIIDPVAAIKWQAINQAFKRKKTSGHCFGMSLAAQQGRKRYPAFEKMSSLGPSEGVESLLDVDHAKQASDEFLTAWVHRDRSLAEQLGLIEREFSEGRKVIVSVSVKNDDPDSVYEELAPRAHALLAYDMVQTPGSADIYVYDSNRPFLREEDRNGYVHRRRMAVLHVDKVARTWSYAFTDEEEWTGGDKGSLWAVPTGAIPKNPSLPGLGALTVGLGELLFSSSDGSVRPITSSPEAELLPTIQGSATPAASGTWVSRDPELKVSFTGLKQGRYSQAYMAGGFVAAVSDVTTAEGVRDTVLGAGDSLRFESGEARPLSFQLARSVDESTSSAATVQTSASAGGVDSASLAEDGALAYAHDGAPTTVDFTLTEVRRNGGPATFASGPISIGRGDRLRAEPLDRELRRVRLTIRDARGRETSRVLRNRIRALVGLRLGAPRVGKHRLTVPVRLLSRHGRAVVGASLRLMRGGHLVARKALALKGARAAGTEKIAWRLPRSVRDGRYRLVVDARAITSAGRDSTEAGSASAHRVATVQVGS
jgi:hypothetical protein